MPSKRPAIMVRLTEEEKAAVEAAARKDERPVSAWVRKVLRRALRLSRER